MGAFGGFFGSGGKENSNNSTTTNRTVSEIYDFQDAQGIAVVKGRNNRVKMTDHKAIKQAFDSVDDAVEDSFSFAAGAGNAAFDFGYDALDKVADAASDTLEYSAGLVNNVLSSNSQAQNDAYQFSAGAINEAFEATDDAFEFTAGAFDASNLAQQRAYESSLAFADNSLDYLSDITSGFMGSMSDFSQNNAEMLAEQQESGLTTIAQLSASSDEKTRQDVMKLAAGFGGALLVGFLIMGLKK